MGKRYFSLFPIAASGRADGTNVTAGMINVMAMGRSMAPPFIMSRGMSGNIASRSMAMMILTGFFIFALFYKKSRVKPIAHGAY